MEKLPNLEKNTNENEIIKAQDIHSALSLINDSRGLTEYLTRLRERKNLKFPEQYKQSLLINFKESLEYFKEMLLLVKKPIKELRNEEKYSDESENLTDYKIIMRAVGNFSHDISPIVIRNKKESIPADLINYYNSLSLLVAKLYEVNGNWYYAASIYGNSLGDKEKERKLEDMGDKEIPVPNPGSCQQTIIKYYEDFFESVKNDPIDEVDIEEYRQKLTTFFKCELEKLKA